MFSDWSVRCFQVVSPSPCDMYEELADKTSHQRVLSLSVTYIPKLDRHALVVAVPLGVAIQNGLVVQTDAFTSTALHYRRCDRQGCYVEMLIDNASVGQLAKSGPEGKIKVVSDGGKNFDLRFSLNGFAAAHDQMVSQNKEKAKDPAAAPAPK
jgi:invasion protein IalB